MNVHDALTLASPGLLSQRLDAALKKRGFVLESGDRPVDATEYDEFYTSHAVRRSEWDDLIAEDFDTLYIQPAIDGIALNLDLHHLDKGRKFLWLRELAGGEYFGMSNGETAGIGSSPPVTMDFRIDKLNDEFDRLLFRVQVSAA